MKALINPVVASPAAIALIERAQAGIRGIMQGYHGRTGDNRPGGRDTIGHSAIQPWSAGELFPGTIATIECYGVHSAADGIEPERRYKAIYNGEVTIHASHSSAEAWIYARKAGTHADPKRLHWAAPYVITVRGRDAHVIDLRTGNLSRACKSEAEARVLLHSLQVRNLINE